MHPHALALVPKGVKRTASTGQFLRVWRKVRQPLAGRTPIQQPSWLLRYGVKQTLAGGGSAVNHRVAFYHVDAGKRKTFHALKIRCLSTSMR